MQSHNLKGFSIAEMLIALAIVVLLSLISVFELRATNQNEELRAAAGQMASDIRGVQSRALEGQSTRTCLLGTEQAVCENKDPGCLPAQPCKDYIPAGYGIFFGSGSSSYVLFADVNSGAQDFKYTSSKEYFLERNLLEGTSGKVVIDGITSYRSSGNTSQPWANAAFVRQGGNAHIIDPVTGVQPEPFLLRIRIRHQVSGKTLEVELNPVTGRVSII